MDIQSHTHGADVDTQAQPAREFLSFRLGTEHYGIDLLKVREIRRFEAPTRMPNTNPVFLGVLDIRGEIVPVWDARRKLGLPAANFTAQTVTVVLDIDQTLVGMVVDEVSDIAPIDLQDIQQVRASGSALNTEHLLGVATVGDAQDSHLLILLDVDTLLQTPAAQLH